MSTIAIKQGTTFTFDGVFADDAGVPVDLTGYAVESQVRRLPGGELIEDLTVELDADQTTNPGVFTLSALATATAIWPTGSLVCDVRFTLGAVVTAAPTFAIYVLPRVTQ